MPMRNPGRNNDRSWHYLACSRVLAPGSASGYSREHPDSGRGDPGAARCHRASDVRPTALLLSLRWGMIMVVPLVHPDDPLLVGTADLIEPAVHSGAGVRYRTPAP